MNVDKQKETAERTSKQEEREKELLEQVPEEIDDNTERGERMATGKTIAKGGQPSNSEEG